MRLSGFALHRFWHSDRLAETERQCRAYTCDKNLFTHMYLKKIPILLSFVVAAALCALVLGLTAEDEDQTYGSSLVAEGAEAPDFAVADRDGEVHRLSDWRGRVVVLDFWASWCPDCRRDIPALKLLREVYGGKAMFVGVSFDHSKEAWAKCVEDNAMDWLQLSELKKWQDSEVAKAYGIKWIPSIVVVGPDGRVVLSTVTLSKVRHKLHEIFDE